MAPSTDHFLYYIYGQGSAASLMLILVNAGLVSAIMLLACSFCKKFRTKEVNFIKNLEERPNSELMKVIVHKDNGIQEANGIKTGVLNTDTELISEEKEKNMSSRQKNGRVHGPVTSESDKTLVDLMSRVLPPPPETTQAAPPAPEANDPLYDSVKDIQERLPETRQNNKKEGTSISKSNNATPPEIQEPQNLDRINPLYESADKVQGSPSNLETKPELLGHEGTKDEGQKVVNKEPLYAVVRKDPSLKRPPGGAKSSHQDPAVPKVVLPEKLNSDEKRVDFIASMDQTSPNSQSPGDKVDSMLNNWKKRSIKSAKPPQEAMTVNVTQEAPPMVPVKRFEIESEVEEYIIEEDTD